MDLCRTSLFCEKLSHLIVVQKTKRLLGLLMTDYKKKYIWLVNQIDVETKRKNIMYSIVNLCMHRLIELDGRGMGNFKKEIVRILP